MYRSVSIRSAAGFLVALGMIATVSAQQPAQGGRGGGAQGAPKPAAVPATLVMNVTFQPAVAGKTEQVAFVQANIANADIELKQYGSGNQVLTNAGNAVQFIPFSLWTGETTGPFALTFRSKTNALDLTGGAKIRWATKTSGFHSVQPVVKLLDGTMFVGDVMSQNVAAMMISEFPVGPVRWMKLDPMRVVTMTSPGGTFNQIWASPDLSKVDEVGIADLIPGSGHGTGGWVHVGSLEVYGKAAPRAAATASR